LISWLARSQVQKSGFSRQSAVGSQRSAAIEWNHGSEKFPGSQPDLARFYTAHSYVFFIPHRRGQGRFPGDYIQDLVAQVRSRRMVELQQAEVDDVIAGLTYLKSQPFVDPTRIAISGCSYGGIQTLLIGERDLGIRALVPFAPGAMSWDQNLPLRERLIRAVDLAKAPVFLIQAENDYSLAPSQVLSQEARRVPNATGTLIASPTAASTATSRSSIQTMARHCAPSAMRIPI